MSYDVLNTLSRLAREYMLYILVGPALSNDNI